MHQALRLLLIATLLLGQTALLAHQLDLDAHPVDGHCEVCLQANALDHTAASATFDLGISVNATEPAPTLRIDVLSPAPCGYQSRGPPAVSA